LHEAPLAFSQDRFVGVVLASQGYPGAGPTGLPIEGLEAAEAIDGVTVFHSGTTERDGRVVTAGGRVLTVVGRGNTFDAAIARAYEGVSRIRFEGMQYRRDIGAKARSPKPA
jgi:phosphoribosylamine--glycine ligase